MKRRFVAMAATLAVAVSFSLGVQDVQAQTKWVQPVRGEAMIETTQPETKMAKEAGKDFVVTTIKIKNVSNGPIAGLKVDEFWWDKAGNPLPGDTQRIKKLLSPGEVTTIVLRTPKDAKMFRNNYNFTHANGAIKATKVKTLEAPAAAAGTQ